MCSSEMSKSQLGQTNSQPGADDSKHSLEQFRLSSVLICLNSDQSMRNLPNCCLVISLVTTGILANGALMVSTGGRVLTLVFCTG